MNALSSREVVIGLQSLFYCSQIHRVLDDVIVVLKIMKCSIKGSYTCMYILCQHIIFQAFSQYIFQLFPFPYFTFLLSITMLNKCSAERMWHKQKQIVTDNGHTDPYVACCFADATKTCFQYQKDSINMINNRLKIFIL